MNEDATAKAKKGRGRPALPEDVKASRVYKYPSASIRLTGKLDGWTGKQVKAAAIWAKENGFNPETSA